MTLQTIDPDAVHYVDLVREIVAWFDVIQNKQDWARRVTDDWPHDWLRRARAATESSENASE